MGYTFAELGASEVCWRRRGRAKRHLPARDRVSPRQSSNQIKQRAQRFPTPRPQLASDQWFPTSAQERENNLPVDPGRPAHTPSARTEVPLSRAVIGPETPRQEFLIFVSGGIGKGRSSPLAVNVPPQHQAG